MPAACSGSADCEVIDFVGTIGDEGGTVDAEMGRVVLDFPPGAVSGDTDIRISRLANVGVPGVLTPTVFDFGPDGATFDEPVTVTLTYDEADLPLEVAETELFIVSSSLVSGQLAPVPGSTVDPIANTVSAPISSFSTVGIAISCLPNKVLLPWCPPVCTDPAPVYPDDPGGELDPTFGTDGTFSFDLGLAGATGVDDLLIDGQGRLLLAVEKTRMGVARILPDGEGLDPSFGVDGVSEVFFGTADNLPTAMRLRNDGRIVLLGARQPPGGGLDLQIARFLPDGALDPSFGDNGVVLDLRQGIGGIGDLATLPDGRILAIDPNARSLYQFLPDGSPDPGFAGDGLRTDPVLTARRVLRRATGRWLLAESRSIRSVSDSGVVGLNIVPPLGEGVGLVSAFEEIPGGGYLIGGTRPSGAGTSFGTAAVSRFQPGEAPGSLERDTCFGGEEGDVSSGTRLYPLGGAVRVQDMAVQADSRIVVAGAIDRGDELDLVVFRIRPDGEIDAGFGNNGIVYLDFGGDESDARIAIDAQGRIVVAGSSLVGNSFSGDRSGVVARLLP